MFHPLIHYNNLINLLDKIGVWEDRGEIVAVAHFEHDMGQAYFEVSPEHTYLKKELLEYAKIHFAKVDDTGMNKINVFINEFDTEFEKLVVSDGFSKDDKSSEPNRTLSLIDNSLDYSISDAYQIQSLDEGNDVKKLGMVLHKGFNHEGKLEKDAHKYTAIMQNAPHYDKKLQVVAVEKKSGEYVSLCGVWYDEINHFLTIEPVATSPDHRRKGLGRAVVYEALKRGRALGATLALVGSGQEFYKSLGFEYLFTTNCWMKKWL